MSVWLLHTAGRIRVQTRCGPVWLLILPTLLQSLPGPKPLQPSCCQCRNIHRMLLVRLFFLGGVVKRGLPGYVLAIRETCSRWQHLGCVFFFKWKHWHILKPNCGICWQCTPAPVESFQQKISANLETICKVMQNELDAFSPKGPPQEPQRGNPANRLQRKHAGLVVVWTWLIQTRLLLSIHLLALHLCFYPTQLDWKT